MENQELEQFCEHIKQRNSDILKDDVEEFIYEYLPAYPIKPNGLLIWGSGNITSVLFCAQEQLVVENIPVKALVNPYASIIDAQNAARDNRLFCSNIYLPTLSPTDQIIIKTDAYCVVALCGVRRKRG